MSAPPLLPDDFKNIVFKKLVLGLVHRVAYAWIVGSLIWIYVSGPNPDGVVAPLEWTAVGWFMRILDFPIAAVSWLLPCHWSAIDLWRRYECIPIVYENAPFGRHMAVSVTVYTILFSLPLIVRALRRRGEGPETGDSVPKGLVERSR